MKKVSEKTVTTVLVTYNRKKILKQALNKLKKQKYENNMVLIIDNASTDGTFEYIRDVIDNKRIFYVNTGKNVGGAGGFSFGLKYSYENFKSDYYWLMDDDCLVKEDSLSKLIDASCILKNDFGFLSSLVLWKDGKICEMNKQKIKQPWHYKGEYLKETIISTSYATFVSFFLRKEVLEEVGLPIKEFFIWGDDVEYSNRISKKYDCFIVGNSVVEHAIQSNSGSNIALDSVERMPRYKFAYRNEVYIAKKNGIKGMLRQFFKINLHIYRVLRYSKKNKIKKIHIILFNTFKGLFFNPKIEYVK